MNGFFQTVTIAASLLVLLSTTTAGAQNASRQDSPAQSIVYDVFITAGQSNARWNDFEWSRGIRDTIEALGFAENPIVISTGHGGNPLGNWFRDGEPQHNYEVDFFNDRGTGALQQRINEIAAAGDVARFQGLFWFQGEADENGRVNGSVDLYESRWNDMLRQLDADLGDTTWNYLMNTVRGGAINDTFRFITDADPRGVLFDTRSPPYVTDFDDNHGYDHYLVGVENAHLFLSTVPEPSRSLHILVGGILGVFQRRRRLAGVNFGPPRHRGENSNREEASAGLPAGESPASTIG